LIETQQLSCFHSHIDITTAFPFPIIGNTTAFPFPIIGNITAFPFPIIGNTTAFPLPFHYRKYNILFLYRKHKSFPDPIPL
jgi:hypothetical protein